MLSIDAYLFEVTLLPNFILISPETMEP